MIARFDSPYDYVQTARDMGAKDVLGHAYGSGRAWDLGVDYQDALRMTEQGDASIVPRVERTVDSLALDASTESRLAYVNEVSGSRVDVPAFLGGNPRCMKRRTKRESNTRHVSVYVIAVASVGVDAEACLQRGCAVLGLVQAFAQVGVACDLHVVIDLGQEDLVSPEAHAYGKAKGWDVSSDGNCTQVIRVESRPLDLSQSGFFVAHPSVFRHIGMRTLGPFGFDCRWSRTFNESNGSSNPHAYGEAMRARLGLEPKDVIILPAHYNDPLSKDPSRFIRERVSQVLNQTEAES